MILPVLTRSSHDAICAQYQARIAWLESALDRLLPNPPARVAGRKTAAADPVAEFPQWAEVEPETDQQKLDRIAALWSSVDRGWFDSWRKEQLEAGTLPKEIATEYLRLYGVNRPTEAIGAGW